MSQSTDSLTPQDSNRPSSSSGAQNQETIVIPAKNTPNIILNGGLGGPGSGGEPGTEIIQGIVPGNLGETFLDLNLSLLLSESYRENASLNGSYPKNHRFRGHREAFKFNYSIQYLAAKSVEVFLALRPYNIALRTSEVDTIYPTEEELEYFYHIREQIRFKEWLLLKDLDKNWFN